MPPPQRQKRQTQKARTSRHSLLISDAVKSAEQPDDDSDCSSESDLTSSYSYKSLSCSSESDLEDSDEDEIRSAHEKAIMGTKTTLNGPITTHRSAGTMAAWILATESNANGLHLLKKNALEKHTGFGSTSLTSSDIVRQTTLTKVVSSTRQPKNEIKETRENRQGLRYTGLTQRTDQRHRQAIKRGLKETGGGILQYMKRLKRSENTVKEAVDPKDSRIEFEFDENATIPNNVPDGDGNAIVGTESLDVDNKTIFDAMNFDVNMDYEPGLVQNNHLHHLTKEGSAAIDSMNGETSWYNDSAINAPLEYVCKKQNIAFINSLSVSHPVPKISLNRPQNRTAGFKKFLTPINRESHWIILSGVLDEENQRWDVEIWNSCDSTHLLSGFYRRHCFEHIQAWVNFRTMSSYTFTEPKVAFMPRQLDSSSCGAFALESGLLFAHGLQWSFTPIIPWGAMNLRTHQIRIVYSLLHARLENFNEATQGFEITPLTSQVQLPTFSNDGEAGVDAKNPSMAAEDENVMNNKISALLQASPRGSRCLEDALMQTSQDIETLKKENEEGRTIWIIYAVKTALTLILGDPQTSRDEVYKYVAQIFIPDAGPWSARRIRRMVLYYLVNRRALPDKRGKHGNRMSILNIPEVSKPLDAWLETRHKFTIEDATKWVNIYLRECRLLSDKESVTQQTVRRKLKGLGYMKMMKKKGIYIDGHERPDVVRARGHYLDRMAAMEPQKALFSSSSSSDQLDLAALPQNGPRIIDVYQDETVCYFNDSGKFFWGKKGDTILEPKTPGVGVMISDFICEDVGLLQYTSHDGIGESARVAMVIGNGQDGYFKGDDVCQQLQHAITIFKKAFPGCIGNFIYDNSTNHCSVPSDALVVSRVAWRSGGQQSVMRATEYVHASQRELPVALQVKIKQDLVFTEGVLKGQPKGCQVILGERGLLRDGLRFQCEQCRTASHLRPRNHAVSNNCCGYRILELEPDFARVPMVTIEEIATFNGQMLTILPKYHCELNPIEFTWAELKRRLRNRRFLNVDPEGFIKEIQDKLADIPLHYFRRCFRHVHRWMDGYKLGLTGKMLQSTVKKYHSHRKIPATEVYSAAAPVVPNGQDFTNIVSKRRKTKADVVIKNRRGMDMAMELLGSIDYASAASVAEREADVDTKEAAIRRRIRKVNTSNEAGTKRIYRCKICNAVGHNKQKCPSKNRDTGEATGKKETRNRLAH